MLRESPSPARIWRARAGARICANETWEPPPLLLLRALSSSSTPVAAPRPLPSLTQTYRAVLQAHSRCSPGLVPAVCVARVCANAFVSLPVGMSPSAGLERLRRTCHLGHRRRWSPQPCVNEKFVRPVAANGALLPHGGYQRKLQRYPNFSASSSSILLSEFLVRVFCVSGRQTVTS
ncbi:hypothetical protein HPB48_010551 [Haemaphysalis longicornis]|uniref:Uncharacterized protein n=1 Tax=Haemaphysalis longicornis TaxID=44386 RepID=A0A9J6H4Z7_HAELO|nr:hypothetical protein HPB48_010551 [Haemaphysalis longicornis]